MTTFTFANQTQFYKGKVRDVYTILDKWLIMIVSDRISAFDVILPKPIPYKGQVLNQIAAYMLNATKDICPNWLISTPAANVSIGKKCIPFKLEMVVRGNLTGHAWRTYASGERTLCGIIMPEGMKENDFFPTPIITPTTKADKGHDIDISVSEILNQGLATEEEWQTMSDYALKLFSRGKEMAAKQGLILVDTKYEFGKFEGEITLMDEIHTPDSSRYFYADQFEECRRRGEKPRQLSKEFVREWLIKNNFMGKEEQRIPEMTPENITSISNRYIELYEKLTGLKFLPEYLTDDELQQKVTSALDFVISN